MISAKLRIKLISWPVCRHRNQWLWEFGRKKGGDAGDNWNPECSFEARENTATKAQMRIIFIASWSELFNSGPPEPRLFLRRFSASPRRPGAVFHQQEGRRNGQEGLMLPQRVLSSDIFPRRWNGFWITVFSSWVPDTYVSTRWNSEFEVPKILPELLGQEHLTRKCMGLIPSTEDKHNQNGEDLRLTEEELLLCTSKNS